MKPDPDVLRALAPTGVLRAAINLGNPILAATDPGTGQPRGVSVDLASATGNVSGGTVLLKMADLSQVQVRTLVDETDIGKIEPGLRRDLGDPAPHQARADDADHRDAGVADDQPPPGRDAVPADWNIVEPGFFRTLARLVA